MKYRWLFFDIGSTLVDETDAFEHRIADALAGTDITSEAFNEKRQYFALQNQRGDLAAFAYFGLPKPGWHAEDEKLYPDTVSVLDALYRKGYKLGIIANQGPGTEQRLQRWDILKYFDVLAASAEMGVAKPDKEIFLRALAMAECAPEDAVMIGDRLDRDIYASMQLGMTAVWIKQGYSRYQTPDENLKQPDYTVSCLTDLLQLF